MSKPVHGSARLRTIGDQTLLTIKTGTRTRHYILTRLEPDKRVAHPAFALENAEGEVWHVREDAHGWACDCPAGTYQQAAGLCKHGKAIKALWEAGRLT